MKKYGIKTLETSLNKFSRLNQLKDATMPSMEKLMLCLFLAAGVSLTPKISAAQSNQPVTSIDGKRNFPKETKLGEITVGVFPEASLDGKAVRFSAAGRIFNEQNFIIVPSTIYQKAIRMKYELEPTGDIRRAWILNAAEMKIAQEEAQKAR